MAERVTSRLDQPGDHDPAAPDDSSSDVTDLLRRLRDAAATHDED
jgi:hypothetical protein